MDTKELETVGDAFIGDLSPSRLKVLNILFLIEASCLADEKEVEKLNDAFAEVLPPYVEKAAVALSDYDCRFWLMTLDEAGKWTVEPMRLGEPPVLRPTKMLPIVPISSMLRALEKNLSRKELFSGQQRILRPQMLLFTKGDIAPDEHFEQAREALNANGWFCASERYAIITDQDEPAADCCGSVLDWFVPCPCEALFHATSVEELTQQLVKIAEGFLDRASRTWLKPKPYTLVCEELWSSFNVGSTPNFDFSMIF